MSARIQGADLEALRAVVAPFDTAERRARYLARDFPRAGAVRDLDKRYQFDLLYAARGYAVLPEDVTDAHIATALRSIVAPLGTDSQLVTALRTIIAPLDDAS